MNSPLVRIPPWLALALFSAGGCAVTPSLHTAAVPHVDAPRAERVRAWQRYRLAIVDETEEVPAFVRAGQAACAMSRALPTGTYTRCLASSDAATTVRRFRVGNTPSLLERDGAVTVWANAPDLAAELRSTESARAAGAVMLGVGALGLLTTVGLSAVYEQAPPADRDLAPVLTVGISTLAVSLVGWLLTTRIGAGTQDHDAARSERYNRWLLGRLGLEANGEFLTDPMVATPSDSR